MLKPLNGASIDDEFFLTSPLGQSVANFGRLIRARNAKNARKTNVIPAERLHGPRVDAAPQPEDVFAGPAPELPTERYSEPKQKSFDFYTNPDEASVDYHRRLAERAFQN